ncbi:MAG: energy-coupling factor transporter transmembrane protein EcfT [Negativicutes bacterium]
MSGYLFTAEAGRTPALAGLHPTTIFTCCMCMIAVVFATVDIAIYIALLAFLGVVVVAGKMPIRSVLSIIKVVLPLCFFITLIQMLGQSGPALAGFSVLGYPIVFSRTGLILGLAITLRVILLALTMTIFFSLVHPARLTRALYDAGMPFKYAYAFTIALRFLPLVISEVTTINNAQKCRGYDIDRCNALVKVFKIIPLMTPLIVTCLRRAGSIALAMDLKAFGSVQNRTFYVELAPTRPWEKLVMGLSILATVSFIVVEIVS